MQRFEYQERTIVARISVYIYLYIYICRDLVFWLIIIKIAVAHLLSCIFNARLKRLRQKSNTNNPHWWSTFKKSQFVGCNSLFVEAKTVSYNIERTLTVIENIPLWLDTMIPHNNSCVKSVHTVLPDKIETLFAESPQYYNKNGEKYGLLNSASFRTHNINYAFQSAFKTFGCCLVLRS